MKHFKLPMIVSGIVFGLMIVAGIVAITWIFNSDISNRKKSERAGMAGTAVATIGCVVIAPFWFVAAAKIGKERREKMGK